MKIKKILALALICGFVSSYATTEANAMEAAPKAKNCKHYQELCIKTCSEKNVLAGCPTFITYEANDPNKGSYDSAYHECVRHSNYDKDLNLLGEKRTKVTCTKGCEAGYKVCIE